MANTETKTTFTEIIKNEVKHFKQQMLYLGGLQFPVYSHWKSWKSTYFIPTTT